MGYFQQYSIKPKEINLIAYGKKKGTKINFTEAKRLILQNNRKQNPLPKQRNGQKQKNKIPKERNHDQKSNNTDIASLQSIIKPLSKLTPIDITNPKTKPDQISLGPIDPDAEIMYKSKGKYVKKKGTGTTPKARKQFFDNPWLVNDEKIKKSKKKKKVRSKVPKSPPPPSPTSPISPTMRRKRTPISPIPIKPGFVQSEIAKSKPNKPLPSKQKAQKVKTPKNDTKSIQKTKKNKKKKIKWDKIKEKKKKKKKS